ncbi:hypothetical protein BKG94_07245 [Rodentibacter ratti]|uniref:HK97-gp10 family putative phage morphogenesis protein n=1 Tax=Rodentibacter ratti TaxID=1906745 RepID=UPI000987975E|nr:HK97-gp10 family putative phage morphogenesis protein [Rodentibacter ratti]OOF88319.1 hypothetical protein BKG94_07245 [Rodentibacter ratti]
MSVKIQGLKELERNIKRYVKDTQKAVKPSIRRALNAGAKSLEKSIKPKVPVMSKSTDFRQKSTIKNNVRHKTKVAKDGLSGITRIRVMRPKGQRMARVGENTKDRRDPFYWWMVEYGTVKMKGRHYMEKGAQTGKAEALRITEETFKRELKERMPK